MMRMLHRDQSGVTLTELIVALALSAVLGAVLMTWLTGVARTDQFQEQEAKALDQMRVAKGRLVKELRFADTIDPALPRDVLISEVIFANGPDVVTWSIDGTGTLTRDDGVGTPSIQAIHLTPGTSGFTISGETVTIEWNADVDSADGPSPKSIRTEVFVRN